MSEARKDCARCKGEGFYLHREEQFYADGSYGGNDWRDCDCPLDAEGHDPRNTVRIGGKEYKL